MAEIRLGANELIIAGVHQSRLGHLNEQLMRDHVQLENLYGPGSVVADVRRESKRATDPNDPDWMLQVGRLTGEIDLVLADIGRATHLGDYEFRKLAPAMPNPRFKPPRRVPKPEGGHSIRHNGASKYRWLDMGDLRKLVSDQDRPRSLRGVDLGTDLSVVLLFREKGPARQQPYRPRHARFQSIHEPRVF